MPVPNSSVTQSHSQELSAYSSQDEQDIYSTHSSDLLKGNIIFYLYNNFKIIMLEILLKISWVLKDWCCWGENPITGTAMTDSLSSYHSKQHFVFYSLVIIRYEFVE